MQQNSENTKTLISDALEKIFGKIEGKFDHTNEKINLMSHKMGDFESSLNKSIENQQTLKKETSTLVTQILDEITLTKRIENITMIKEYATEHDRSVKKLILIDNETKYVTCSNDSSIHIYDSQNGKLLHNLRGHTDSVQDIILLTNGYLASCSADNSIKLWNLTEGTCVKTLNGQTFINCIVEAANSILISASQNNSIRLWDLTNTESVWSPLKIVQSDHQIQVGMHALCLIDGNTFASGSQSNVHIYQINSGQALDVTFQRKLVGHSDWVKSIQKMKNKEVLISASLDRTCKAWNSSTGECLRTFCGHTDAVLEILVLTETLFITSGKELKFWSINSEKCLKTVEQDNTWICTMAKTEDLRLFSCGGAQKVRIYRI